MHSPATPSRRQFLAGSAALGASLALPRASRAHGAFTGKPGKLLILGGTRFLGPAVVHDALARGWEITLFNRGKSDPGAFPELEHLIGDRDGNLDALKGREWDAVVDTSAYVPRVVRDSAELLKDHCGHYVFVSTVSVYDDKGEPLDESSPVGRLEDPSMEQITGESYGPLKALCEEAAEEVMPGRVSNVRPGLIVGPEDNSGRFTYWPLRVMRGGEVLAPGNPDKSVEFIDVRDLGAFLMECCERKLAGVFNANGPGSGYSMAELLYGCKTVLGSDARWTWIPDEALLELEVGPWMEMPLWIPASMPNGATVSKKAVAAGLKYRPVGDTIRATYDWAITEVGTNPRVLGGSLKPEKEAEVLKKWAERKAGG